MLRYSLMQNTLFWAGDASQFHVDSSVLVHTPCQPGIGIERRVHHSDQRAFAQGHVLGIGGCVVNIAANVERFKLELITNGLEFCKKQRK